MDVVAITERLTRAIADLKEHAKQVCDGIEAGWVQEPVWGSVPHPDHDLFVVQGRPDSAHDAMHKAAIRTRHRSVLNALVAALPPPGPRLALGFEVFFHRHGSAGIFQSLRPILTDRSLATPGAEDEAFRSVAGSLSIPDLDADRVRALAACAAEAHALPAVPAGATRWVVSSRRLGASKSLHSGAPGAVATDEAVQRVLEHHAVAALAIGCDTPRVLIERITLSNEAALGIAAAVAADPASPATRVVLQPSA